MPGRMRARDGRASRLLTLLVALAAHAVTPGCGGGSSDGGGPGASEGSTFDVFVARQDAYVEESCACSAARNIVPSVGYCLDAAAWTAEQRECLLTAYGENQTATLDGYMDCFGGFRAADAACYANHCTNDVTRDACLEKTTSEPCGNLQEISPGFLAASQQCVLLGNEGS